MGNQCSPTASSIMGALGFFFALLLMCAPTAAPRANQTYYLDNDRQIIGELVQLTKNNLVIRREMGGMAQFAIRDLMRVEITTDDGNLVSGRLVAFEDGVFEIEGHDRKWSIRGGTIIAERTSGSAEEAMNAAAEGKIDAGAAGAGGPVIRIQPISIAVASAKTRENAEALRFDITLNPASDRMIALIYTTMGDSAIADADYVSTQGVISIEPGTTSLSIDVPLVDDEVPEPSERFTLYLATDPTAARIDARRIEGLIEDDD